MRRIFLGCCASGHSPANRERDNESKKPHQFSIFDFGF